MQIRLLQWDHENLCVFVFSRLSARPALAVPQAKGTPGPATILGLMPPCYGTFATTRSF